MPGRMSHSIATAVLRDPAAALAGAFAAWGGHKGSGLGIVVQLLGIMAGSPPIPPDLAGFGFLIVTMRPDGSAVREVTHFHDGETNAYLGSYSPDGQWVVFRLEIGGLFGLYRMHPDGSQRKAILAPSAFRPSLIDWGPRARSDVHGA